MSNIFLITTKNNNYPEIDDKNKIYLGNWCLQNKYIADKGEKIADYHWDDRDKLEKDLEKKKRFEGFAYLPLFAKPLVL